MSLKEYEVDLRSLDDDNRKRVYELLDLEAFMELKPTNVRNVYTLFMDERINPDSLPGLPAGLIRRLP